jgi:hypothetical protein
VIDEIDRHGLGENPLIFCLGRQRLLERGPEQARSASCWRRTRIPTTVVMHIKGLEEMGRLDLCGTAESTTDTTPDGEGRAAPHIRR